RDGDAADDGFENGDEDRAALKFFEEDAEVGEFTALAADFLGEREAEPALIDEVLPEVAVVVAAGFNFANAVERDFALKVVLDRILDELLSFGKRYVHICVLL